MDEVKFLTALNILWEEAKKQADDDYNYGYKDALYDIFRASELCKNTIKK